jgi:hypothetical protein
MKVVDLHWRLTFQEEAMLAMGKCLSLHCWKCNPNTKIGSGAILGRIILKACFYGSNGYMRQADLDAWGWPEWYWEDSEFVGNGVHVNVHVHVHVQENNGFDSWAKWDGVVRKDHNENIACMKRRFLTYWIIDSNPPAAPSTPSNPRTKRSCSSVAADHTPDQEVAIWYTYLWRLSSKPWITFPSFPQDVSLVGQWTFFHSCFPLIIFLRIQSALCSDACCGWRLPILWQRAGLSDA